MKPTVSAHFPGVCEDIWLHFAATETLTSQQWYIDSRKLLRWNHAEFCSFLAFFDQWDLTTPNLANPTQTQGFCSAVFCAMWCVFSFGCWCSHRSGLNPWTQGPAPPMLVPNHTCGKMKPKITVFCNCSQVEVLLPVLLLDHLIVNLINIHCWKFCGKGACPQHSFIFVCRKSTWTHTHTYTHTHTQTHAQIHTQVYTDTLWIEHKVVKWQLNLNNRPGFFVNFNKMCSAGYTKSVPPSQNTSVAVKRSMYVFWIRVSEVSMDCTMQVYFRTTWRDNRLQVVLFLCSDQKCKNQKLFQLFMSEKLSMCVVCVFPVSTTPCGEDWNEAHSGRSTEIFVVSRHINQVGEVQKFVQVCCKCTASKWQLSFRRQNGLEIGRVWKIEVFLWSRNRIGEDTLDPLKMREVNSLITLNSTGHVRIVRR